MKYGTPPIVSPTGGLVDSVVDATAAQVIAASGLLPPDTAGKGALHLAGANETHLDGALLLPGSELPLQIFEPRYLNMVDDAMAGRIRLRMPRTPGWVSRPGAGRATC